LTGADFELVPYTPPGLTGADFELGTSGSAVNVNPSGVVVEVVRGTPSVARGVLVTPSGVLAEAVAGTPSVDRSGSGVAVYPSGILAEVLAGTPSVVRGVAVTPSGVVVEAVPGVPISGSAPSLTPSGVVVEAVPGVPFVGILNTPSAVVVHAITGTPSIARGVRVTPSGAVVEWVLGAQPIVRRYNSRLTGAIYLWIARPNGEPVGIVQTVTDWEMKRELNRVGTWAAKFPADAITVDGQPLGRVITRGWRVSALQEGAHPDNRADREWLMRNAVVEAKEFQAGEGGTALCAVSGSLRGIAYADRFTPPANVWLEARVSDIARDLVPDIITPPAADRRRLTLSFAATTDAATSFLFRLLRVAELGHFALRESWDEDRFELVDIDALPAPRYLATSVDSASATSASAGRNGVVLIGESIKIARDGAEVANRIIPYGVDILADGTLGGGAPPEIPLTLQLADRTVPGYPVRNVSPGVYALEDPASIARYGLIERVLVRSDLKVPVANELARRRVANALYVVALGELRRRRSPRVSVSFSVANGPDVWLLPGDTVRVVYSGGGWEELDLVAIVRSRVDRATLGGAREVVLTVETPETPIPTIDIGDGVPTWSIPVWRPSPVPGAGGGGTPAPTPGTPIAGCCSDPTTDVEDNETPPAPETRDVPGRLVVYAGTSEGRRLYFRDAGTGQWSESPVDTPTGNYTDSGELAHVGGTTIWYRAAQPPGSPFHPRENAGWLFRSTDWGETWASVNVSEGVVNHFNKRLSGDGALVLRMITEPPDEDDPETYGYRTDVLATTDGGSFSSLASFDAAGIAVVETSRGIAVALTGTATTGSGPAFDVPPRVGIIRGDIVETVISAPADVLVARGERSHAAAVLYGSAGFRVASASIVYGGGERYALISTRKYNSLSNTWDPVNVAVSVVGKDWEVVGFETNATGTVAWVAFTGGLWRTRDGGEHWESMLGAPSSNIRGIAYDAKTDSLYVWVLGPPRVLAYVGSASLGSAPPIDITRNLREVISIGDGIRAGSWSIEVLPSETSIRLSTITLNGTISPVDYSFEAGS
jgi:hypothetical protein